MHDTTDESGRPFAVKPHVVICDLGIAEVCCRGIFGLRGNKVAGTPATMAPEVWAGSCGPKSDVWSMGCVMFEMFTNRLPFEVKGGADAVSKQQARWVALHSKGPDWSLLKCSAEAVGLCRQLLTFRESVRPSALEVFEHPWLHQEEESLTPKEIEDLCTAIMGWQERSPCQRAFCLKVAANCTCIDKFAKIFSKFDSDHSGVLDTPEVVAALISMGISHDLAEKTSKALDVNGDESCEYLEFTAACLLSLEDQFDDLLRQEFRVLDSSRDGVIDIEEMEVLLVELRALASSRGLVLEDIDEDGDGTIDFQEFCSYFGRPGVAYSRSGNDDEVVGGKKRSSMPMKQHVRILGGQGMTMEMSMENLKQSMGQDSTEMRKSQTSPAATHDKSKLEATDDRTKLEATSDESKPQTTDDKSKLETTNDKSKAILHLDEQSPEKKPGMASQKKAAAKKPAAAPAGVASQPKKSVATPAAAPSRAPAAKAKPKAVAGKAPVKKVEGFAKTAGRSASPESIASSSNSTKVSQSSRASKDKSSLVSSSSRSKGAHSGQNSDSETVPLADYSGGESDFESALKPSSKTKSTTEEGTVSASKSLANNAMTTGASLRSTDAVRFSAELGEGTMNLTRSSSASSIRGARLKRLRVPSSYMDMTGTQRTGETDTMRISLSAASLNSIEDSSPTTCGVGCFASNSPSADWTQAILQIGRRWF